MVIIVFALFFGTYLYSKNQTSTNYDIKNTAISDKKHIQYNENTNYNWIEYSKQYTIKTYSLHVLAIFASLWALGWYILHHYFGIQNSISSQTYIFFFALFSLWYSTLSGKLIYKFFSLFSNSDETEASSDCSLQTVLLWLWLWIKNHILLLIMGIALIILAWFIAVQSWLWGSIQQWQQERKWYENFRVIEDDFSENDEFDLNNFDEFGWNNEELFGENNWWENWSWFIELTESKNIWEIYTFSKSLQVGTVSDQVWWLEDILKRLWYFEWEIDEVFDENTRQALIATLQNECGWPETTTGTFGSQAQNCLYSLNMNVPITTIPNNQTDNDNNNQ